MAKLTMVRLYKDEDVPDHILEEVKELFVKMARSFQDVSKPHGPNIILSALNRVHAAVIFTLVEESELKQATEVEAIGLMRNVEHISGKTLFEKDDK